MTLSPPRFDQVRLREGYAIDEVDAYVERITSALSQDDPGLTPDEVDAVRFQSASLGAGYDMAQVDMWLYQVAAQLRERATAPSPAASTSASHDEAESTVPAPDRGLLRWPAVAVVLPVLALVTVAAWYFTR